VRSVDAVAVRLEHRPRRVEGACTPAEVARHERDLSFRDHASGPCHRLSRTKGANRPAQEGLRTNEIAELRHRDPSKGERRGIAAQRDPLQRAQRIAQRERARRCGDQRVH